MRLLSFIFIAISFNFCGAPHKSSPPVEEGGKRALFTGAEQTDKYVPYLKGKRVAIMANQTSIIGDTHLVDSLKKLGGIL